MEKTPALHEVEPSLHSRPAPYPLPFRLALRMKGALTILGLRKHEALLPRLLFMGGDPGDVITTLSAIHTPEEWPEYWCKLAMNYEKKGYDALEQRSLISAANALRLATIYYRIAEYMVQDHEVRANIWRKLVQCYCTAGRFFIPPLTICQVTAGGIQVPVHIRIPVTQQSVPCIITLGGVDGVKEEWYHVGQEYIERGWACVTLDLPGQGELRRLHNHYWRPDSETILSAVIDTLETYPSIDKQRIVVVGGSAGGYFALRAAAHDERILACALLSSPVSLADVYHTAPPPIPQTIEYNLGATSRSQAIDMLQAYNVEPLLKHIHCPIWLVYGGKDTTTMPHHSRIIKQKVRDEVTELYYPDGDHICFNHLVDWQLHLYSWLENCFHPSLESSKL